MSGYQTKKDIRQKVGELVELRGQADELNKRVEDMENDFKACMERNGLQEVDAGEYRVRYVVGRQQTVRFQSVPGGVPGHVRRIHQAHRIPPLHGGLRKEVRQMKYSEWFPEVVNAFTKSQYKSA